jgi:4-aminobutyrate aminotransferase/(S)-3-amino-2-methylpropionate transaminase
MEEFVEIELDNLYECEKNLVDPSSVAAIIMEPVQGEGGFNPIPKAYFEGLRAFCDKHGIMLIADEVQSGFGRTGYWASWQHYGVTPDISTYAKSMGSGMPIAAILGRGEVMDAAAPGTIGGTYIGNPVCCAASLATIKLMKEVDINRLGKEIGGVIVARFEKLLPTYPEIGDVRGLGAMIGIEFVLDRDPRKPNTALCKKIADTCAKRGLIVITAGTYKNVIRILSPLVISSAELSKGLDILEEAIIDEIESTRKNQ